jgi:type IV secretory pathway VirB2 component (pilin)
MPKPRAASALLVLHCALALLITSVLVLAATGGPHLAALERMTGTSPKGGQFAGLVTYLDNLQASILPIAGPIGVLGLIGGGVAYLVGHHMAQKILAGVVIGTGLVLLSPQLMA